MAETKFVKAVEFGQQNSVDPSSAVEGRASLPKPIVLPANATLKLVEAYRDDQVTWIEVKVQEPAGGFIPGLGRIDFDLFDGERRISLLSVLESVRSGQSRDVAVLLDCSISTEGKPHDTMILASVAFVTEVAQSSRIKIWAFADHARPITRWSQDRVELANAIRSLRPGGGTALFYVIRDAIDDAALLEHPAAIVLFTDGTDTSKGPLPNGILNKAIANRIPFHVVALRTGEVNEQLLRQVATQTGGKFYSADRPDQLLKQFRNVAAEISKPVYRLAILEPIPSRQTLKLQVGELQPISVSIE